MKKDTLKEKKIAVIYVNYRCASYIGHSIRALKENVSHDLYLVVVDNSSEYECKAVCNDLGAKYVDAGDNLGFAGGCNLGVASIGGGWDYVLFMNPDAYCDEDFLSPMVQVMENNQEYGVVGPLIRKAPGGQIWYAGSTMRWWRGGPKHVYDDRFINGSSELVEVPFVSGCCMLVSRLAWNDAGPMDTGYFLYFEDTDFNERVKRQGYKVGFVPGVQVMHEESTSTSYQSPLFLYYFSRNRVLYLKKWAPRGQYVLFMMYDFLVKVPGSWVVFGVMGFSPRRALAFTKGAIDGIYGKKGEQFI